MSKYIKGLIVDDVARKLQGVSDAIVCNVIGLDSEKTVQLRKELRSKGISLLVVKNALARRAAEGTSLSPAFDQTAGSMALIWGAEDFISLCKEMVKLYKKPEYEKMKAVGGVMDGERLTAEKVEEVSKWPNRVGQLSILLGQILSPGATLLGQLAGPGGELGSQVQQIAEGKAGKEAGAGEPAPAA
jgi:ribosomal protein L10